MSIYKPGAHLNGELLCCVDCETTGPKAGYNDLIEVCCIVLGPDLRPAKGILPFNMELQPRRLENIDLESLRIQGKDLDYVVKEKLCKDRRRVVRIATNGCDADLAADLFADWWNKLRFAPFKRLLPIAHNWVFDREFIIDWLGEVAFDYYFSPRYRDTMGMSLYDNDVADWRCETFEYPKNSLTYLCSQLHVDRGKAHTALDDVLATIEVYRRLVTRSEIRSLPKSNKIIEPIDVSDEIIEKTKQLLSEASSEEIQRALEIIEEDN